MRTLLIRLVINGLALWAAAAIVDGVDILDEDTGDQVITVLIVALIFALVNTLIKPVLMLFTLPLFILTLGLITFVINALMLWLTGGIASALDVNFSVEGFWPALLGAFIITIVSWALSAILPD